MKQAARQTEYSKLLRDPQWQKKRLEVMQRDEFTCQSCGDGKETLNVHHTYYVYGNKPWEYPLGSLITLCESCHYIETQELPFSKTSLIEAICDLGWLSGHINRLASAFLGIKEPENPEVLSAALAWMIQEPDVMNAIVELYFKHIKESNKKDAA